ncbi:predicted Fe-S-cluster redox enzyme [Microbacterium testaceum StLB037]|uniref:Predicted Fe-S-cluster redox enzyme n=1 Tax=Microbacterium testaceum (strain StLB037) TaxID=979556 RepID=E8N7U3_MICTS|nr:antitoxin HicB [Microbacterium testaceum]BAJ74349.1 predicted Fe-S-cluster redox enzyme [Microbacterium testaceum StLB037]
MTRIDVIATRWDGGWELAIDGDPVTQVRTLDRAEQQVRDYLDTLAPDVDHGDVLVNLIPDLGADVSVRVREAREATAAAQERQVAAARQARTVVRELRAHGVTVSDAAVLLGVSPARISQLSRDRTDSSVAS